MLLEPKVLSMVMSRTFKNFGHKRQPIPLVTTLWHGFLTFTFAGMCLNWEKISVWVLGENSRKVEPDWDDETS